MSDKSSCRPIRLNRYNDTVQALCDGLVRRNLSLQEALVAYRHSCESSYYADCSGAVTDFNGVRQGLRVHGTWAGDVGDAFCAADIIDRETRGEFPARSGFVNFVPEWQVTKALAPGWNDPFRGVLRPGSECLTDPISSELGGPPTWLETVEEAGTLGGAYAEIMSGYPKSLRAAFAGTTVDVFDGRMVWVGDRFARARMAKYKANRSLVPALNDNDLKLLGKGLRIAGNAATLFVAGYGQWGHDGGRPTGVRLVRATTRGTGVLLGSLAGESIALTAVACAPLALLCAAVTATAGSVAGGFVGDKAVNVLPWMDDPAPGELNPAELSKAAAAAGAEASENGLRTINLLTEELLLNDPTARPVDTDGVPRVVPQKVVLSSLFGCVYPPGPRSIPPQPGDPDFSFFPPPVPLSVNDISGPHSPPHPTQAERIHTR